MVRGAGKSAAEGPDGQQWPAAGVRLGLPAHGPGSVAGWGRRVLGIAVDWVIASLIGRVFLVDYLGPELGPLLVFALMHLILVSSLGFSIGHFLAGIAVRRLDNQPVGLLRGALRTLLLCLVIPAVVYDHDRRGLHDKAAEVVVIRR